MIHLFIIVDSPSLIWWAIICSGSLMYVTIGCNHLFINELAYKDHPDLTYHRFNPASKKDNLQITKPEIKSANVQRGCCEGLST